MCPHLCFLAQTSLDSGEILSLHQNFWIGVIWLFSKEIVFLESMVLAIETYLELHTAQFSLTHFVPKQDFGATVKEDFHIFCFENMGRIEIANIGASYIQKSWQVP